MSSVKPPFVNAYGHIGKVLARVAEAQQPSRFTQDFLNTVLGFKSSSVRPIVGFFKRIGFLNSDASPTQLYQKFRNPEQQGIAVAEAMRIGYSEIFSANEYAYKLPKAELKGLIVQLTGLSADSTTVGAIVGSFEALNALADFEVAVESPATTKSSAQSTDQGEESGAKKDPEQSNHHLHISPDFVGARSSRSDQEFEMNLSYTINLNLPESTNPEVFNAIFKSLKENLLK